MWIYDIDSLRFLAVNDAAVALYGYSREEFLKLTLRHVRPQEDVPALEQQIENVRQTLLFDSGVWRHYTKNGAMLHVKVFGYTVEFRGKLARCVQIHNVTAEHEMLQRQETIERFLAVMRHTPIDYWTIVTPEGIILHQSESARYILGYPEQERIGQNTLNFVHPDDVHLLSAIASELTTNNDVSAPPLRVTYRYRHANGHWIWVESVAVNLTHNPFVRGLLVSSRDVSERKQREDAIETSERFLRSLFMAMPDIVLVLDRNGRYMDVVTTNASLLYRPIEEIMGRTIGELFTAEQTTEWLAIIRQALDAEQIVQTEYALEFTTRLVWFEAKVVPLAFDRVLWVARDITDRKAAQEQLQQVNEQLQRLNEEKNSLLEIVAHDLKNPLMGIRELASMIADHDLTMDEMRELARSMRRSADRSLVFVQEALSSEAIASGAMNIAAEPVAVDMLAQHVMESYTTAAASKHLTLRFETIKETIKGTITPEAVRQRNTQRPQQSQPLSIALADEGALFQVIDNLVSNAVKYSPPQTTITVRLVDDAARIAEVFAEMKRTTSRPDSVNTVHGREHASLGHSGHWVMMTVADEGPGFSTEDMDKLFTKFTRLSAQPTGGEHSTGLGLAITKQLVERMNGHIWCNSVAGHGATFTVMLPAA
jgi:PAS domain S-box-containing protein